MQIARAKTCVSWGTLKIDTKCPPDPPKPRSGTKMVSKWCSNGAPGPTKIDPETKFLKKQQISILTHYLLYNMHVGLFKNHGFWGSGNFKKTRTNTFLKNICKKTPQTTSPMFSLRETPQTLMICWPVWSTLSVFVVVWTWVLRVLWGDTGYPGDPWGALVSKIARNCATNISFGMPGSPK